MLVVHHTPANLTARFADFTAVGVAMTGRVPEINFRATAAYGDGQDYFDNLVESPAGESVDVDGAGGESEIAENHRRYVTRYCNDRITQQSWCRSSGS